MHLTRRNRILRQSPAIRAMVAETILRPADFIAPLFITSVITTISGQALFMARMQRNCFRIH